ASLLDRSRDLDGRAIDEVTQAPDTGGVEPLGAFADLDERTAGAQHALDGDRGRLQALDEREGHILDALEARFGDRPILGRTDPQLADERLEHGIVRQLVAALLQLALDFPESTDALHCCLHAPTRMSTVVKIFGNVSSLRNETSGARCTRP